MPQLRGSSGGKHPSSQTRTTRMRNGAVEREPSLLRWATPRCGSPTFPVPGERLVAITHTFRHIF